jgi:hypothetical protein
MNETVANVVQWGLDRNIIQDSNLPAQLKKLREEFDELEEAILTNNSAEIADAIGDMTVVLTIMAEIYGRDYDPEHYEEGVDIDLPSYLECCLEDAYNVIKDRKGKLINGVFVKESDLVDN